MSAHISTFSDSDLSLHLSEGSTLSSESDHSIPSSKPTLNNNKKKKSSMADKKKKKPSKKSTVSPKKTVKPVKEEPLYCICRQPYDGKAFMIECDNCQEWFHGQCVGINPKSVIKHYYCDNCQKKIQDAKATNAKGRGKKANTKKATSRKKSNKGNNTNNQSISVSLPSPPTPLPPQQNLTSTSNSDQVDEEDEDLDDICPICEFECTCGTSVINADPIPSLTPPTTTVSSLTLVVKEPLTPSLDTPKQTNSTSNTLKQPKQQATKGKKGKIAKKSLQYDALSDDEDVDILDEEDNNDNNNDDGDNGDDDDDDDGINQSIDDSDSYYSGDDGLIMDPFSSDDDTSGSDDDPQIDMDNLSPYPDSQIGSYSSSIHIDSGEEEEEDIEQEEERAIIAEMMEHGLSDANDSTDDSDDENEYYIEDEDSEDVDYANDNLDPSDDMADEEAYYRRSNGLWASSDEEEEDDDDDDDMTFHSDPGPLHSDDGEHGNLETFIFNGDGNSLFTNIAEAFVQVLAPLATGNQHIHSDSTTVPNSPVSAVPLNVATFDLGANAADYLNSAPTSPISHRTDDFLRRPSLPSSTVLAAHGHRDMDLASDALSVLSSVLSSEALLPIQHPTIETNKTITKPTKDQSDDIGTTPSISSPSVPLSGLISTITDDTVLSISPETTTESSTSTSSPSSSSLQQQQQPVESTETSTSSINSTTPPAYDLASLLPPDMKIPEQLLDLIKSSLAASFSEKGGTTNTSSTATSSTATSSTSASSKKLSSATISRQLLPKPTLDGSSVDVESLPASTELEKKRPSPIVTQPEKKRRRSDSKMDNASMDGDMKLDQEEVDDDVTKDEGLVSMDELLDTSQLDTRSDGDTMDTVDDRYARDLSRWERVPIGAFRLMRSKNRLWLNR